MRRVRRLTAEQVLAIRWAPEGWCGDFACAFGISRVSVWKARLGFTYRELGGV